MAYTPDEIQTAQIAKSKLIQLIEKRKEQEKEWIKKGEIIIKKTDDTIADINGYTLLDYAIIMSDFDEVKRLVQAGATSKLGKGLNLAIKSGSKEIFDYLQSHQFKCQFTSLPTLKNDLDSLSILKDFTLSSFNKIVSGEINSTLFGHLIAFIDPNILKERFQQPDWQAWVTNLSQNELFSDEDNKAFAKDLLSKEFTVALEFSAKHGNLETITFLIENGTQVSHRALNLALEANNVECVKLMLPHIKKFQRDWRTGRNALHSAILSNNPYLVRLILDKSPDVLTRDFYGLTALHYAAESENPAILELLMAQPEMSTLLSGRDFFGRGISTPLKKLPDINQVSIISKLQHYLFLTNQNPNTMPEGGHCSGLVFMFLYYSEQGKEDTFFNILNLISRWDGSYESLENTAKAKELDEEYKDLNDVFFQFSQEAIWFMQNYIDEELKSLNPGQKARESQYNLIKKDDDTTSLKPYVDYVSIFTQAQVHELLNIFSQIPGTKMDICGDGHSTGLVVHNQHQSSYYDPNQPHQLIPFESTSTLSEHIENVKYQMLAHIPSGMMSHHYDGSSMEIRWIGYHNSLRKTDYSYFSLGSFPKSQADIDRFRELSPGKLTPLHVSILVNCASDLKSILSLTDIDVNLKDAHGLTPLDMALMLHRNDMIDDLLNHPTFDLSKQSNSTLTHILSKALNENDEALLQKLIETDIKIENLKYSLSSQFMEKPFISYILEKNPSWLARQTAFTSIDELLKYPITEIWGNPNLPKLLEPLWESINTFNENLLEKPLFWAIENNPDAALLFIKNGVDINIKNALDLTPIEASIIAKRPDIAIALSEKMTDINQSLPTFNMTLLHASLLMKNGLPLARYLLKNGAQWDIENNQGKTALELAKSHMNPDIRALFERQKTIQHSPQKKSAPELLLPHEREIKNKGPQKK